MQRPGTHISTSIMNRMSIFENTTPRAQSLTEIDTAGTTMMSMSSSPPATPTGVQTDSDGLILPKKLINPCMESTDRKELHRELKFNARIGKSVLNQKTELQRAYEKQKERHAAAEQHSPEAELVGGIPGLKGELGRVIMERAQKHEAAAQRQDAEEAEERQYVNPEYLNVRAKLRTAHAPN
ncbi:protein FAM107B isoform X1 [Drosophila sulfurigaster albostrigata]|uniref:protein FAM107B isoform X1 n=1 Tax=Drosophila sulfurigaster albostrigata TaxID=89887 RepID=UPI002D21A272|nr:protein FAM107B isoform X1 [Drosophila sulfurigaster albostrigata]